MRMFESFTNKITLVTERVLTGSYYLDEGGSIRRRIPKKRGKLARKIDKINRFNNKEQK